MKKANFLVMPALLLIFAALLLADNRMGHYSRMILREAIENDLVNIDKWPESRTFDAMYILGGHHRSQKYKFETASRIHKQKICRNIIFLSVEDTTAFDQNLSRNFTNDEWSLLKMKNMGIPASDVMALTMEEGMLGTMNEAENVAKLVMRRGYASLLIVAAPYHSQRVRISYEHFLKNSNIDLVILGSGEQVYLKSLVLEWIKLKLYKIFLLIV